MIFQTLTKECLLSSRSYEGTRKLISSEKDSLQRYTKQETETMKIGKYPYENPYIFYFTYITVVINELFLRSERVFIVSLTPCSA